MTLTMIVLFSFSNQLFNRADQQAVESRRGIFFMTLRSDLASDARRIVSKHQTLQSSLWTNHYRRILLQKLSNSRCLTLNSNPDTFMLARRNNRRCAPFALRLKYPITQKRPTSAQINHFIAVLISPADQGVMNG